MRLHAFTHDPRIYAYSTLGSNQWRMFFMSHAQQSVDIQGWVNMYSRDMSLLLTALLCSVPAALVCNTTQDTFELGRYLDCRASLLHPSLHVGCSLAKASWQWYWYSRLHPRLAA
jgi:hypothetical protein